MLTTVLRLLTMCKFHGLSNSDTNSDYIEIHKKINDRLPRVLDFIKSLWKSIRFNKISVMCLSFEKYHVLVHMYDKDVLTKIIRHNLFPDINCNDMI